MPMLRCQGGLGPGHGSGVVGHPRGLPTTESPISSPTYAPVSGTWDALTRANVKKVEWECGGEHMALACKVKAEFKNLVSEREPGTRAKTWMTVSRRPLYPHSSRYYYYYYYYYYYEY